MYIGDLWDGSGLAHMLWEVVANALDGHLAGHCSRIAIEVDENWDTHNLKCRACGRTQAHRVEAALRRDYDA